MIERFMLTEELESNVIKITGVDYTGMLTLKDIHNIIKDLVCEYHRLEEKFDDYKEHCKECHQEKKINYYEEYGIDENDFH